MGGAFSHASHSEAATEDSKIGPQISQIYADWFSVVANPSISSDKSA
jgi:hypothetical protein